MYYTILLKVACVSRNAGREMHFPVGCLNQPSTYLFAYLFHFMSSYACLLFIFVTALFYLKAVLYFSWTNSLEPFLKNWSPLWNPNLYYYVHKGPLLDPILS